MAAMIWLVKWGGPRFYIYVWALIFGFSLLMLTLYPTLIAPLFNKYEPLEDGQLRKAIETLASKVNDASQSTHYMACRVSIGHPSCG
jgi:STE24 endopeptidase